MSYRRRKKWRFSETPLGRLLGYRPCIVERYCPTCNRPYFEKPEPTPIENFVESSAAALVYEGYRWGRKVYRVRVGRYQVESDKLSLAQLLEPDDLDDVLKVIAHARDFIGDRRTPERGESKRSARR